MKELEYNKQQAIKVAIVAAMGGLLFGFDTGVISGALLFLKQDFHLGAFDQGLVTSAILIGAICGALFSGRVSDRFGRKNVIIAMAVVFAVGSIATALAPNVEILIVGRIVLGVAIGVASYTVPLYISEVSPTQIRGALVSLNQLMITIGIVMSYLVDLYFATSENSWRWMFGFGLVPSLMLFFGMLTLPNSPRWLILKGRIQEASAVLTKIYIGAYARKELESIKVSIHSKSSFSGRYADLLKPAIKPALIIGVGIMFFQQVTGINTVIYYSPTILQMAGFGTNEDAILAALPIGIVNVLMTLVSIYYIDKLGRKPLLYIGMTGMILGLIVLGGVFAIDPDHHTSMTKILAVGSLIVYISAFAVSMGPIAWLLIAEVFPLHVRNIGMSISTLSNWGFNFIVALTFLSIVKALGAYGAFWLYAFMGVISLLFIKYYVPETKGKTLEEIEAEFAKRT